MKKESPISVLPRLTVDFSWDKDKEIGGKASKMDI